MRLITDVDAEKLSASHHILYEKLRIIGRKTPKTLINNNNNNNLNEPINKISERSFICGIF